MAGEVSQVLENLEAITRAREAANAALYEATALIESIDAAGAELHTKEVEEINAIVHSGVDEKCTTMFSNQTLWRLLFQFAWAGFAALLYQFFALRDTDLVVARTACSNSSRIVVWSDNYLTTAQAIQPRIVQLVTDLIPNANVSVVASVDELTRNTLSLNETVIVCLGSAVCKNAVKQMHSNMTVIHKNPLTNSYPVPHGLIPLDGLHNLQDANIITSLEQIMFGENGKGHVVIWSDVFVTFADAVMPALLQSISSIAPTATLSIIASVEEFATHIPMLNNVAIICVGSKVCNDAQQIIQSLVERIEIDSLDYVFSANSLLLDNGLALVMLEGLKAFDEAAVNETLKSVLKDLAEK
ncbi:hypothetical protein HDU99_004991, partial [Rhizoclosmatium hyalinum]